MFLLSDKIHVCDTLWIVGDDFVSDMIGEFLQAEDVDKPYMREYYDVKVLCSTSLSPNKSVSARLHNNFVNALPTKSRTAKSNYICFGW